VTVLSTARLPSPTQSASRDSQLELGLSDREPRRPAGPRAGGHPGRAVAAQSHLNPGRRGMICAWTPWHWQAPGESDGVTVFKLVTDGFSRAWARKLPTRKQSLPGDRHGTRTPAESRRGPGAHWHSLSVLSRLRARAGSGCPGPPRWPHTRTLRRTGY
jgi:hypothetical protein